MPWLTPDSRTKEMDSGRLPFTSIGLFTQLGNKTKGAKEVLFALSLARNRRN